MKLLSLILFYTICSAAAFSQDVGVHVGVKAGTDIHKMSGKSFDEEFKFGYHVGAFLEIKLRTIGIQPEVYFSQVNTSQGQNATSIFNLSNIKKAKLSYLNIPILLNVKFSKNVAIQLGPQYGILINENLSGLDNGKDAFKKGDFSLNGGLQIKVSKFRVYGRYNVGLSNVNDDKTGNEKWKNQTVHVGVGYAIL